MNTSPFESLIPTIARDESIMTVFDWMVDKRLLTMEPIIEMFYQKLGMHLIEFYDIYDQDIPKRVYDQCIINMLEEKFNHVEA